MTLCRVDTEGCRGGEQRQGGQVGGRMQKKKKRGGDQAEVEEESKQRKIQTERGRESKERLMGEGKRE